MPTTEEIKQLKASWVYDPIWDIEETEGFEEHKDELLKFRLEQERLWGARRARRLDEKSIQIGVPGNWVLAQYIEFLESQIDRLENRIEKLER